MDIHKPKPWHGLREFLKEYLIIVVGVLTALAAEQAVEWLHWQAEVAHTRAALRQELSLALGDIARRIELAPCVTRRSDELQTWLDESRRGGPLRPSAPIGRVASNGAISEVWESVKASPVSGHLPEAERLQFARLYATFNAIRGGEDLEREAWLALQDYEGAPKLDLQAQMRLQGLIARVRFMNESVARVGQNAIARGQAMGIAPPHGDGPRAHVASGVSELCRPLFAEAAA